jgi:hypothetical protein
MKLRSEKQVALPKIEIDLSKIQQLNWSLLVGLTSALRGELFHITLLKYLDLGCFVFCMKDFAISSRVALLNHKHCGAERRSLAEIWTPSDPDRNVFASERVSGERR